MDGRTAILPCYHWLILMVLTVTYGQQFPPVSAGGSLMPDFGENFPKLSIDCLVEFVKYGKPLIEMASSNSSVKLTQETLAIILQSPMGKMIDAWGKLPPRVFNLHTNWMGSYEECASMSFTKYCSSNMKIYGMLNGIYGSCMPKGCSEQDVHKLLNFISKNYLQEFLTFPDEGEVNWKLGSSTHCEKPVKYNTGFYVTLVLSSIILVLCLLGSFVDGFMEPRIITKMKYLANGAGNNVGIDNKGLDGDDVDGKVFPMKKLENEKMKDDNDSDDENGNVSVDIDADPLLLKMLRCFSLQRNIRAVMGTEQPKGAITSVHGIRALSMFWVIVGHVFLWSQSVPNDNTIIAMAGLMKKWSYEPIVNSFVSVDSFFLLSGLLVSYLTFKKMDKTNGKINAPMYYLHRFLRLTPLYMFVILFWNNIFPYTIFGPLAPRYQTDGHFKACNKYWWSNLLYINNFYPENFNKSCLDWSWYLANDMQFHIVAPGILLIMYSVEKHYRTSKWMVAIVSLVIAVLCTICVIINAIMVSSLDYPSLLIKGNIPGAPRQKSFQENHDKIYTKPYTRINPYLVGILLGYLLSRKVEIRSKFNVLIYFILWLVAFGLGYAIVYGPYKEAYKVMDEYFSDASNVMYGAFHRLVWAVAVAYVVYACHNGYGGYINSFLSWGAWVPISRLTFAAYLVHPMVIFFFYGTGDRPFHYQDSLIVYNVVSNLFWAYACAFLLAITVEYPSMNLEKLLLMPAKKP